MFVGSVVAASLRTLNGSVVDPRGVSVASHEGLLMSVCQVRAHSWVSEDVCVSNSAHSRALVFFNMMRVEQGTRVSEVSKVQLLSKVLSTFVMH